MDVSISRFTTEHLPALREIFLSVRQKTFYWFENKRFELNSFDTETEGEFILVAHAGNSVAGFLSVWLADNFIHHLYIKNEYQNLGIGTALLTAIKQKLNSPITLKCLKKNEPAIAFYKKHGFREKECGLSKDGEYILFECVF